MRPSVREIAFHEVGHAVVAEMLSFNVEYVTASESGGVAAFSGVVDADALSATPSSENDQMIRKDREDRMLVCCAGPVAQYRCGHKRLWWAWMTAGEGDRERATDLAAQIDPANVKTQVRRAERRASKLLAAADVWAAVKRVADALLVAGTLQRDEFLTLVGPTVSRAVEVAR